MILQGYVWAIYKVGIRKFMYLAIPFSENKFREVIKYYVWPCSLMHHFCARMLVETSFLIKENQE